MAQASTRSALLGIVAAEDVPTAMQRLGDHAAALVDAAIVRLDAAPGHPAAAYGAGPERLRAALDASAADGGGASAHEAIALQAHGERIGLLLVAGNAQSLARARETLEELAAVTAHVLARLFDARLADERAWAAELARAAVESLIAETALPVVLVSPDLRITATNAAFDAFTAQSLDEVFGKTLRRVGVPAAPELELIATRVAREGRAERSLLVSSDHPWLDVRRTLHISAHPVRASSGEPLGVGLILDEATARSAAHDAARLVTATTSRLVGTADMRDVMDALIAFSASIGDACFVHLGRPAAMAAASFADAARQSAAEGLPDALGRAGRPRGIQLVLRTQRADVLDPNDLGFLAAGDPALQQLLETLAADALLCVPIGVHGCLTIVRGPRPFDVSFGDVVTRAAEDVGRGAAVAIERTRAMGEAHETVGLLRDYASALSREVRDAVTALSTRLFLAERTDDDGNAKGHFDALRKNVDRLRDALHRISPAPAATRVAKVRRFALVEIVERVLHAEAGRIARRALDVTTAFEPLEIEGDEDQLSEATRAILRHVIEASPKRALLCVRVERTPREAMVTISHTGAGFSVEEARRVFDAHWSRPDGRGRALVVARSIVEAHGGRAWIESAPDAGAAYCFAVPMRVSSAA